MAAGRVVRVVGSGQDGHGGGQRAVVRVVGSRQDGQGSGQWSGRWAAGRAAAGGTRRGEQPLLPFRWKLVRTENRV